MGFRLFLLGNGLIIFKDLLFRIAIPNAFTVKNNFFLDAIFTLIFINPFPVTY